MAFSRSGVRLPSGPPRSVWARAKPGSDNRSRPHAGTCDAFHQLLCFTVSETGTIVEQRSTIRDLPTERDLLREAVAAVRRTVPASWTDELIEGFSTPAGQVDAVLRLATPDGADAVMVIKVKRSVEPRDVSSVVAQLRTYAASMTPHALMVIVAPFLSRQTRHLLDESAIGYVDFTGNTHLKLDRPALYIRDTGAERTPYRVEKGPLQSLKGRAVMLSRSCGTSSLSDGRTTIRSRRQTELGRTSSHAALTPSSASCARRRSAMPSLDRWPQLASRRWRPFALPSSLWTISRPQPRRSPYDRSKRVRTSYWSSRLIRSSTIVVSA